MLDRLLLDRLPLHIHKAGRDTLGKNLEERNGVINDFEVKGDLETAVEAPPLALGGGIFIEDGCREPFGDCLL